MTTTITTEANLAADPELRFTKLSSQAVCTCQLAISARRKNMDGEYEDTPPVFVEATVWGVLAEHVAESLRKGDRVLVHGTTYDDEWTDREGNTRVKHVLQVQAIGASLRYATTTIHRVSKAEAGQQSEPAPLA
jgi:single-strand DNA-binding protein